MKKIHRSIMDKSFFVSVCVHTSNCSNPNKKQVKYKHSHYRNENWWNTFSLTVMDFSLLRRFVPSSITDKTFTGLWVIRLVSHNKQKLLTIREQLCPPPPGFYWGWGVEGLRVAHRCVICFVLFSFYGFVPNVVCVSGFSIFDRSFGFLLRLFTCDTANKMSLQYDIKKTK